jgi:AGCS family alanine or glycine:cation symporter
MIVKYAEIVLAVFHRDESNGEAHGGAMYYIKYGLKKHGISSVLAGGFAAFCLFSSLSTGSVIQVNAVSEAFYGCFSVSPETVGIVMAILCAVALFSSKKNVISDITVKLVPLMSLLFISLSLVIIFSNLKMIPDIVSTIVKDAFAPSSAIGGIGGFIFSRSVRFGVTKGLFSNEAGCGTSTIAHAQANSTSPKSQGVWGIFEVFFDTVLLCTLTALVLLICYGNSVPSEGGGVMVALSAYGSLLGQGAKHALAVAIFLFAYATVICWAYYGCECVRFLFKQKYAKQVYLCVYVLSVIYGAVAGSSFIWELADLTICVMMSVNTVCVCAMSDTVYSLSKAKG